jgi:hypothetical protein
VLAAAGIVAAVVRAAPDVADLRYIPFAMEAAVETQPSWAPDGKTVAYVSEIGGVQQILTRGVGRRCPRS